jgi:serine/threonine-protein kinase
MIEIPGYAFMSIKPIDRGVSGDRKYRVVTSDGYALLLRVSDPSQYDNKKTVFDALKRVEALGVPISRPVDFGFTADGDVYQLLTWCSGSTADAVLPTLTQSDQYALGIQAGKILRTLHTLPTPDGVADWYTRYAGKNDERIDSYLTCGVKIDGGDVLYDYYQQNRHRLRDRPQCFNHGDYHADNLMVSDALELSVIDWDLYDDNLYGDPWWEFNRILHTELIPSFATGMLRGYFCGDPPEEFWRVLAVYLTSGVLMLVSWGVYVQPDCLDECKQTAANVLQWYNGMQNFIPAWYLAMPAVDCQNLRDVADVGQLECVITHGILH